MSVKQHAKQNNLDFLYDLHTEGVELEKDKLSLLEEAGFFDNLTPEKKEEIVRESFLNDPALTDKKHVSDVDKHIDIVTEEVGDTVMTEESYKRLVEEKGSVIYSGLTISITPEDWRPESISDHTKEFIEWIDSISFGGFINRINYRKLNLYCQQAYQWIAENDSLSNYAEHEDREAYKDRELERCAQNTLYFMNKYLKLKESSLVYGLRQYLATPAHEIILYLLDCGYSVYILKPRQIAATSTIGGFAIAKTMFNRNHFIKFVTESDKKGQEIFEDKIKYPFAECPDWMRDDAKHDSGTKFALGTKDKKGDRAGTNSNIDVVAPSKTAISGGSPQIALIDEAGNIPILTAIIEDARPTSFWMNPVTKRMERKRQIAAWGTGGDMERGGKAFEREFMNAIKNWRERKFAQNIIPIFFDWTTRPGITQDHYDSEKELAYSKEGLDADQSKVTFRQQYPSCIEDAFITSSKTLVSQEYIADQMDRIAKVKHFMKPKYGYFEPIYGTIEQPEGSDIPFNIIGANFIPCSFGDPRVSTTIFQEPKPNWVNRYYSGTDPIASDTGTSNMARAVWDKYYNTVSAIVDFRTNDYREVYLQTMLLGVYYDVKNKLGIKELLETNIGIAYREYVTTKGRFDTLVFNSELPEPYQAGNGSGNIIGIDNKGVRNKMIINTLYELIQGFGDKIYIDTFFIQLKTFVATMTVRGNETWGVIDKKYYKDDVLFAVVYSYLCAQCFAFDKTFNEVEEKKNKPMMVSTLEYDKNYTLQRVYKRVR